MYICEICSTAFDEPVIRRTPNGDGEHTWFDVDGVCPICGTENRYMTAKRCSSCGKWVPLTAVDLCKGCRSGVKDRFSAFLGELTPAETQYLDGLLDGTSVTDWRK